MLLDTTSQYAVKFEVLYPSINPFEFASIKFDLLSLKPDPLVFTILSWEKAVSSASFIKFIFSSLVKCVLSYKFRFFSPLKCNSLSGKELYSSIGVTFVESTHLSISLSKLLSLISVELIEAFFFPI